MRDLKADSAVGFLCFSQYSPLFLPFKILDIVSDIIIQHACRIVAVEPKVSYNTLSRHKVMKYDWLCSYGWSSIGD